MAFMMFSTLLQQLGDERGPAGLVARADARAGVAVEVLVERNQVVPVGIGLEQLRRAEHRPATTLVLAGRCSRRRRESSAATSPSVIIRPDPVGHSTL